MTEEKIDLSKSLYDQGKKFLLRIIIKTLHFSNKSLLILLFAEKHFFKKFLDAFSGRAAHFYRSVNPLNLFRDHAAAKELVDRVKLNKGVLPEGVRKDEVWDAKYVYESAYHPSTGELTFLPGRMSFQGIKKIM